MESITTSPSNPVGFWLRLGAGLLDAIIVGLPLLLITYIITGNTEDNLVTNIISSLYSLLVPVFWHGYTVGKRIVGIRIARIDGEPVGVGTMLLRNLVGGIVYVITLGLGIIVSAIMIAVRQDKRSIHDLIAGTYVTSNQP
ncbi:RDD family protein [Brevibacillus sp. M2.1A]|uniref:RDD family protein n=1 Tax=Brevibacillus TaxID=55080 RepID=UPI00156BC903|nr:MULTISPECIES: RDD family protein [Brevibacillus]MBY0087313.1 RDD family protein [Brevibacillus brevis]MCC8437059.1 RDD family protein [Brevibacillus sp. M2.1A]MCE0449650.1 RDD family protein [Brevibacillus sp. AF8]MCM3143204.1 RDD family protein [Brevibacillus sp. MER 51]UKK99216.1 RDD family protein [Brevibacillus brevis]